MNFAIVRSMFGNYWVGKTKLPVNGTSIFADYSDAFEEMKTFASYEDVVEQESTKDNDEIEVISKNMEKFII